MKRVGQWVGLVLVTGLMLIKSLSGVEAIEGMGVGLFPANPDPNIPYSQAWLIYNLVPGESKRDAFIIVNKGNESVELKLYPVDATLTKDGAFALLSEEAPRKGVGSWVKLDVDKVKLAPGEQKKIGFVFSVPKDAEVGDHMGGIVAEKINQNQNEGAIKVKTRIGLRIYETVPGELKRELQVGDFKVEYMEKTKQFPSRLKLVFNLSNTGNVHLNPMATVELIDNFGRGVVKTRQVSLGTIFPGKQTTVPVMLEDIPWWGSFVVKAKVMHDRDLPDMYTVKQAEVFYISGKAKFIAAVAGVLLAVVAAVIIWGRSLF